MTIDEMDEVIILKYRELENVRISLLVLCQTVKGSAKL